MINNPLKHTNTKLIDTKILVVISFILVFISGLPLVTKAAEASLFLAPRSGEYQVGSTFSVKLKVDSDGAPINAAGARILFPPELLRVKRVSKAGSIFKLWPEVPTFSNSKGEISFKGGVPAPGFTGVGTIFSFSFEAKKVGEAKVSLTEAAVLAADGRGTDVLAFSEGSTFSIIKPPPEVVPEIPKVPVPPKISSPTHPQEDLWYRNSNPEFQWELSPDIIGATYEFDQNPSTIPEALSKGLISSARFAGVQDGVWYFHLRVRNRAGWSKTSHLKVQIDTTPPQPFDITVDNQGDPTNPQPLLYFEAKDDMSGTNRYEIRIDGGDILSVGLAEINPFKMSLQMPGTHKVLVRAIDKAGNFRESFTYFNIESIPIPEILIYPKTYIAGTEVLYLEGTAPPNLTVIITFKKDAKTIKTWQVPSDKNGKWIFSTDELFKSGIYQISARSRDERGAVSDSSPEYPIKVILGGISVGPWTIGYSTLFLILIILIALLLGIIIYYIWTKRRKIKKETKEAAQSLQKTFDSLKKKITKKIEYLDSKPGLSRKEKKLRDELINILKESQKTVSKEIQDIEKELKFKGRR